MSKYKNTEDIISFFLSSATEELPKTLPFRTGQITSVSQAIGIIVHAIADAKKEMPPRSTNDLYQDAYYMAVAIIAKSKAEALKPLGSLKNLRKILGTDKPAKTRKGGEYRND